jgi:transcriptional regulator with XRE-family HTH domain
VQKPSDIAARRIRELRKRHGWTQQQLTNRLNHLGAQIDRVGVAKVELGQRKLPLDEVFWFAQALSVAPVNLLAPIADDQQDEPIELGANFSCSPAEMRRWVRGQQHFPFQDPRVYYTEVPTEELPEELRAAVEQES